VSRYDGSRLAVIGMHLSEWESPQSTSLALAGSAVAPDEAWRHGRGWKHAYSFVACSRWGTQDSAEAEYVCMGGPGAPAGWSPGPVCRLWFWHWPGNGNFIAPQAGILWDSARTAVQCIESKRISQLQGPVFSKARALSHDGLVGHSCFNGGESWLLHADFGGLSQSRHNVLRLDYSL
jgi:hypothetical protein